METMSVRDAINMLAADTGRYAAAQVLVQADRERCAAIFKRYIQACSDAWGPGASNPPKASDYLDEILATPATTEEHDGVHALR